MKIFITGATGFLGSHITNLCVNNGYDVLCLKRSTSISPFEPIVEKRIKWVNSDNSNLEEEIISFKPDILIHAAWGGVSARDRNNTTLQKYNTEFSEKIFRIYQYKQIIALGSQAEYGYYKYPVNESSILKPINEYGKAKIECCNYLSEYCRTKDIEWQWMRIFTIFGEHQRYGLIPSAIKNCLNGTASMDTTNGEQIYSFMYALDFAKAIINMIGIKDKSGIYNISSIVDEYSIKEILLKIKKITSSDIKYNFGAIPYSNNQIMYMSGSTQKYENAFGNIKQTNIDKVLAQTIDWYKNNESF